LELPININDILTGRTVEWERLEFKSGWNPKAVLRTLCAFANDFHNLSGGYLLIGVEENNGRPVLPPKGLSINELDKFQKEIVELGYKIQPYYHPVVAPCEVEGKHILVLYAAGGQNRPYKAPVSLSKDSHEFAYYIRKGSVTARATHNEEVELIGLAANVPFDDRINQLASLSELDLGLIRTYLKQIRSDLFELSAKMNFGQLCQQMNIADGPPEALKPNNVGLMFFNENPGKFFPQTQIDVVHFPEGPGADNFTEKIFKGPLGQMLGDVLIYIKNTIIQEKVIKHPDRPKADRFYNYPFSAIEEAVCNAVYHRSYEIREPVEIQIYPDRMIINSFPGPDRSIRDHDIHKLKFLARRYRNRRIGEFLKELDMTEGRGTGIPKMLQAVAQNESPLPIFHTDEDRSYFTVEFGIHPVFSPTTTGEMSGKMSEKKMERAISLLRQNKDMTTSVLAEQLGVSTRTAERYIKRLKETGRLRRKGPDKGGCWEVIK